MSTDIHIAYVGSEEGALVTYLKRSTLHYNADLTDFHSKCKSKCIHED